MTRLLRIADRCLVGLSQTGGVIAALLMLGAGIGIFLGIITRMFGYPLAWPTDIVPHLLLVSVMLSAPEALRRGEHIAVDLLVSRLGPVGKRFVSLWAYGTVIFLSVLLIQEGIDLVSFSHMTGMRTHDRLDLPVWWFQSVVPVGGVLLLAVSIRALIRALLNLPQDEKPKGHAA